MRRSLPLLCALLIALPFAAAVAPAGAALGGPTAEVGSVGTGASSTGRGLGLTGALPIHPQALATAKHQANANATGNARLSGGDPSISASGWSGAKDSQVSPPDSTGAIGPSSYIELVNLQYAIYDRSGGTISTGPLEGLTGTTHNCLSDPQVIWDADGARFFYLALDTCNNTFDFGFSKTSAPTGAGSSQWCQYAAFQYGSLLPDFPKLGDSSDFLLIGTNVFQRSLFSYTYLHSDIDWINKADLTVDSAGNCNYTGIRAGLFQGVRAQDGSLASTPVPANGVEFRDPSGYVVADPDASSQPNGTATYLSLFRVTADASGNAVLSTPTSMVVPGFKVPANAKQRKTTKPLDTSDARLTQAVAAVDPSVSGAPVAVWTQHTVFGGAGAEVRWYEISGATGALLDSGKVTSSSLYSFNAAISPDRSVPGPTGASYGGSMGLTFNTSSGTTYSAIKQVTQPVGGVQSSPTTILQSTGRNLDFSCSSTCRWGDYAGASPDPIAGATGGRVWFVNQWNVASVTANDVDWRTQVFNVGF